MLERLHDAFETQERFAANASHELRTPLTVTATLLEVAQADPAGQDYPTLLERLRLTNARAIGITEALLRLSNANAIALKTETLDLADIVSESAAEIASEASDRQVSVQASLASAHVSGDRTLLEQMASNLIQNAIRHNCDQGSVVVTTSNFPATSTSVLRVENSGAFYTPELAVRLMEPFLRGDARTRKSGAGHGLGLALVERITKLHGGKLSIVPREQGGLRVEVTFPAAAESQALGFGGEPEPGHQARAPQSVTSLEHSKSRM
jgi:two-component system sensor histidine kinase VanS